jgi:heme exporter protein A
MRLIAESLAVLRGERVVFRNLNFDVAAGQALVLHGPNGSGKTTLLRILAGLLAIMSGKLRLLDNDGKPLADEQRDRALHFITHQDMIRPQLRVRETLRFHAALLGTSARDVDPALEAWGLGSLADVSGALLSAGQRRRLSLARLSLQQRSLWLLDEPLVALDAPSRQKLNDACAKHLSDGGTIVAASHETFLAGSRTLFLGAGT